MTSRTSRSHKNDQTPPKNPSKKSSQAKKKPKNPDEYSDTLRAELPAKNPLKAFLPKPIQIFFDSQLSEEKVVLMLRRHPITLLKPAAIALAAFFIPFLFFSSPMLDFFPPNYKFACVIGWYMILISFVLETFLVWFFNVFIVTDERIIDVDFINLIFKNIASAKIDNIEDITTETGGVLASIVDFGTVYIQTAGEKPRIEFEKIPQPAKVVAILNELILEEEREKLEGRTH